jgi:hypothetical protein
MPAVPEFNAGWKNPDLPIVIAGSEDVVVFCLRLRFLT